MSTRRNAARHRAAEPCGTQRGPSAVALLNSNEDLVELIRVQLETVGFVVVSGHVGAAKRGTFDLRRSIEQHDPCVSCTTWCRRTIANWRSWSTCGATRCSKGLQVVLTSANAKQAESLAGRAEHIYEIIGKPYDLDQVVQAVRAASRSRPVK